MFRSYCRTHGRLGLTLNEFREFLLVECHVSYQSFCIHNKVNSVCTVKSFLLSDSGVCHIYPIVLSLFLFVSVDDMCLFLQWPESECETARLRELMRFHDHHHGAFKKYISVNKPKLWEQTAHLLSYAGFLRYVTIILPARSAVCILYWSNYVEHTGLMNPLILFYSFLRTKHNAAVNPIHNNVYQVL